MASHACMFRALRVVLCGVMVLSAACGGGSTSTTSPSTTVTNVDLTGNWDEINGGTPTTLKQTGSTITGTTSFSDQNAYFGRYASDNCTIAGTASGSSFTFTITCPTLYNSTMGVGAVFPGCVETVTCPWTINSASNISGPYSQVDTCNGVQVFTQSKSATLVRR